MRLSYRPPYDWQRLHAFLAVRALRGVEAVDGQSYARVVRVADGGSASAEHALIRVRPADSGDALELTLTGCSPACLPSLAATARRMFDLDSEPERIGNVLASDPLLAWSEAPGLRIPGVWDPFECAVRAILGQQVSVAAGRTFAARIVQRVSSPIETGIDGLTHAFPTAAQLCAAALDGLGITGARLRTLQGLSAAVADGRIDFGAPASQLVGALTGLPGIGDWTAQYVALRGLRDPDAFMAADLVLRRVAGAAGSPATQRRLSAMAESWRPWRGYALLHLWRQAGLRPG